MASDTAFILAPSEAKTLEALHTSWPLKAVPNSLKPYAELARIHRPAGIMMFYFPFLYGTCLVGSLGYDISLTAMLTTNAKLLFMCVWIRSWLCTYNDIVDAEIDRQVTRTRIRPLARKAISIRAATVWAVLQTFVVVGMFSLFSNDAIIHALPFLALHSTYPFAKRFTHHPQLILGFAHCLGIFVAFPVLGQTLFSSQASRNNLIGAIGLSTAIIFWTMLNDTIYAAQDIEDDKKAGVGSTMVYWGDAVRNFLRFLGVCQILALLAVAYPIRESVPTGSTVYTALTCCGTALGLLSMVELVDLSNPASCGWWFNRGNVWVGVLIGSGLLGEYLHGSGLQGLQEDIRL